MEKNRLHVLMGMDSYLPTVDGVINCMHNYCLNLIRFDDVLAIVPRNVKGHVDDYPYPVLRCRSLYLPILRIYYGRPLQDKQFFRQVMAKKFDIVHVHSPFAMSRFAVKVARKKGIPVVATAHTNFRPIFKSIVKLGFLTEALVRVVGRAYNRMDEVFVCSPMVERQVRSFGYTGKISYLPFGTELEKVDDKDALSRQADQIFGLNPDGLVFIFVGRVMPLKRIDFIIDSLNILQKKGIAFTFFVVGKGFYSETLRQQAERLGLADSVKFLGFIPREQFPLLFARADLLLFPSLYDNFGLVKVEAAAYSTPGVFVRDSAAGFDVEDGHNGYLSDDSVEAFAEKIEQAVSDRKKLKDVGINAGKELYINWAQCVELLDARYREIIANRHTHKES
jgi:1,2-diacylglycerol 3-alpha-glucosyltransferase